MSVNGTDVAAVTIDGLNAAFKRVAAMAEGKSKTSLSPALFTESALKEASENAKTAKETYQGDINPGNFAKLAYARALERDLSYCLAGRKYMLATGLTKKCMSISSRAALLTNLE